MNRLTVVARAPSRRRHLRNAPPAMHNPPAEADTNARPARTGRQPPIKRRVGIAMTTLDAAEVSPASASLAGRVSAALLLVEAPCVEAVFIFSTSTVFLRSSVLPSWVAYLGYVAGLVMFLAPPIWVPLGYAFPTWVFSSASCWWSFVNLRSNQKSEIQPFHPQPERAAR